jgi:nicotinic acid mononucleotide adenylyltransferase
MLRLALAKYPYFKLDEMEIKKGGLSYTLKPFPLLEKNIPMMMFIFSSVLIL